jgi:hypothetical protein
LPAERRFRTSSCAPLTDVFLTVAPCSIYCEMVHRCRLIDSGGYHLLNVDVFSRDVWHIPCLTSWRSLWRHHLCPQDDREPTGSPVRMPFRRSLLYGDANTRHIGFYTINGSCCAVAAHAVPLPAPSGPGGEPNDDGVASCNCQDAVKSSANNTIVSLPAASSTDKHAF